MIRVKFKNMEQSELAIKLASERIAEAVTRFPKGYARSIIVTLAMETSRKRAVLDLYKVRAEIIGGRYHGFILEKEGPNLSKALVEVKDGLLERLNRFSLRARTQPCRQPRNLATKWDSEPARVQGGRT